MDLLKIRSRALIAEVRELRERERSAKEQVQLLVQKQKQSDEEYGRKLQELQAELASSNEIQQKLQREVNYLQDENSLLETKQKELNMCVRSLLQSKKNVVNAYEESTCEMKRAIQCRDRKIVVLHEKIKSHLMLFDSIEKEAISVKKVVDDVQHLVSEKEDVVVGLKSKMESVSSFEKVFIEKICNQDKELRSYKDGTRRKDMVISELEAQLEAAKLNNNNHKVISAKDMVIQSLISVKQGSQLEVESLGMILRKIQDTMRSMNQEDKRVFSSILEQQQGNSIILAKEDNRIQDSLQNNMENSEEKTYGAVAGASSLSQKGKSVGNTLLENNNFGSCVSEAPSLEAFKKFIEINELNRKSMADACLCARECGKNGLQNEVVELLIRELRSCPTERKITLLWLVNHILRASRFASDWERTAYLPAFQDALQPILDADDDEEYRKRCKRFFREWEILGVFPSSCLRPFIPEIPNVLPPYSCERKMVVSSSVGKRPRTTPAVGLTCATDGMCPSPSAVKGHIATSSSSLQAGCFDSPPLPPPRPPPPPLSGQKRKRGPSTSKMEKAQSKAVSKSRRN